MARRDLPLSKDASARFLPWLVAFMVYLAVLALAASLIVGKTVERWDSGLSGRLTVQIPPAEGEGRDAVMEARIDQVVEILTSTQGVDQVRVLDQDDMNDLLGPWLGEDLDQDQLPLPQLVAVTVTEAFDLATLQSRLETVVPGAVADDHQRWLGNIKKLSRSIVIASAIVVFLVGLAAVITVIFVTRTGLAIHRSIIELLHLMGAQDHYIAGQFQSTAFKLGITGGLGGLVFALLTILGQFMGDSDGALFPEVIFSPIDWLLLATPPLITTLIAMITARRTVLKTLARMP